MDYLRVSETSDFDYDSSGIGGNRYATVLLYMTDIPENGGGETGEFLSSDCSFSPFSNQRSCTINRLTMYGYIYITESPLAFSV